MLSPELKAQAQMAWSNWKYKLGAQYPSISEEEFVNLVLALQSQQYKGLIPMNEFDQKLNDILKNPGNAVEMLKNQPQQRSTDSLLRELEALHKSKVLNDDEFEERKSELNFQRNGNTTDHSNSFGAGSPEERRQRLVVHLDALLAEKAVTQLEYEAIKARF